MTKKKIVIAGGGLTGLSAAWHLKSFKRLFLLFEKEKSVGGLCSSNNVSGFIFDRGGHVFHFRKKTTFCFVRNLLGRNLKRHKRIALFHSFGRYGHYPIQANLRTMPSAIIQECLREAQKAFFNDSDNRNENITNLKSWILAKFGSGIARHFLIPYNTKFWTVPLKDLTCEWASGVIPTPSLREITFGAKHKPNKSFGYNAEFWYPQRGGIEQLPLAMASGLKNIVTDCAITGIDLGKREVTVGSGAKEKFDYLITTIPLPGLMPLFKNLPDIMKNYFLMLRWNSILNVNLGLGGALERPCHWMYFPEKEISFFRSSFPHHFSSATVPQGKSSLSLEIAYSPGTSLDKVELLQNAVKDARKVGLLSEDQEIDLVDFCDIAYGYPIYDHNYARARQEIMQFLKKHHIIPAGRYGAWRYMSMEDALLDGKSVARELISQN